jgi:hypothetical protein
MGQKQFNAQLDELLHTLENTLPKKYGQITRAGDRARLMVEDIVARYADSSGRVPRNKQGAVVRDLQRVEGQIYRDLQTELQTMFYTTSFTTADAIGLALQTAINTAALIAVAGIAKAYGKTAWLLLSALIGKGTEEFIRDIAKTPFTRKDADGLRLNDRLRDISRTIIRQVSSTLRKSIRNGEVSSSMNRKVATDFKSLAWRLKTIVETEVLYVMRNGIATFAELSGIAKGIRIQDYPHGKLGEHERHACYHYAHADEHGMGRGVYPVGTRKIRNPHPRCRSTLHLVLHDKLA